MNEQRNQPLPPGAQDVSPLLALLLAEVLEIRVKLAAQDIFITDLLTLARQKFDDGRDGASVAAEALAYKKGIQRSTRAYVQLQLQELVQRQFPAHWPLIEVLLREEGTL